MIKPFKLMIVALMAVSGSARGQYIPPKFVTQSPMGVDLATGNFRYQVVDLSIGPLSLERSYVSGKAGNPPSKWFGPHWTHNFDIYVREGSGKRFDDTYVAIGRKVVTFSKGASAGTFFASKPESMSSSLEMVNGAYVFTNGDGDVYVFNSSTQVESPNANFVRSQRIGSVTYANGHRLDFYYSSGLLSKITSNFGYAIVFEYNSSAAVSKSCVFNQTAIVAGSTCAGANSSVSYAYTTINGALALASMTDSGGQIWGYDYNVNGAAHMTCVRLVNSSSCRLQNTISGYAGEDVSKQVDANGAVWNYYIAGNDADNRPLPGQPPIHTSGAYEGPDGLNASVGFDANMPTSYQENGRTVLMEWDGMALDRLIYPEGNLVTKGYDGRYNSAGDSWTPKSGSTTQGVSNVVMSPSPELGAECGSVSRKICNKPLYRTDYRGNRTDYIWDPNSGLLLTETGPANSAGIRPVKRNAYEQRYARISNGAGGYVQVGSPIWVLVSEKTCQTTGTSGGLCGGGVADEVTTAYDYGSGQGASNLLVRGVAVTANGITRRTCYGYDAIGNRIWETRPRAALSACPVN